MINNLTQAFFEKLTGSVSEPQWLLDKRNVAFKNFLKTGLPDRKSELWKYTNVNKLQQLADLKAEFKQQSFSLECPDDIDFTDITKISPQQWLQSETDRNRVFAEVNTAFLNSGFHISIPANSQVKLKITYHQMSADWQNIRSQIVVGENAHLELHESYDSDCRINHVSYIEAAAGSKIRLKADKHFSDNAALLRYSHITCRSDVEIIQGHTHCESAFSHYIQDVNFNGTHCQFTVANANSVSGSGMISDNILINHNVPDCKSEVIKRSIASDVAQISVNAKAVVKYGADGSDISQSLKNILLSETAKINSRPELEINTDDVVAAHGSTIGQLNEQSLNYLRSRGIPKDQAQKILIESFLQEANIFNSEDFMNQIQLLKQ